MKTFLTLFIGLLFIPSYTLRINPIAQETFENWRIINDGVMGGLSKGKVEKTKEYLHYTGSISFENNGGFSSYRSGYNFYDLSNYSQMEIEFSSEGGDFMFTMETAYRFYEPYYAVRLENSNGKWKKTKIKLDQFSEKILGRDTGNLFSKEDLSKVIRIGFLKNDKREGAFEIKIKSIAFS